MSEPTDVSVVREAYGAIMEGGPESLIARYDEFFTEDFVWAPALIGGLDRRVYAGREGFAEYWRDFTDAFADIGYGDPTFSALGAGRVLVASTIQVTGVGGGVPIDTEAAYLFEIRDGRIAAGRTFFSREDAEEFAGREAGA